MTTPTVYRSDDGSAPVISGQTSALRLALNAILVDGYGAKAAAGWTKAYEDAGSHLVAYRQGGGAQKYLALTDSAAQISTLRSYDSMTAVSTGIGSFPRFSTGTAMQCRKSVTADSTARPWICYATDTTFYLIIFGNQASLGSFDGGDAHLGFGDMVPALDYGQNTFIIAASDTSTTSTTATVTRQGLSGNFDTSAYAVLSGRVGGVAYPFPVYKGASTPWTATISGSTSNFPAYPDPATGLLNIAPFYLTSQEVLNVLILGRMPGLWCLLHPYTSFTSLDTFSGAGNLAGRTFQIVKTGTGALVFETGGNW